jgi:ubiquinone/menaquinone biosynthesis C-methylase UbiE
MISLCRGQAASLPFADQAFRFVVCTFPTAYVHDPAWLEEAARVLQDSGRLIIVAKASFYGRALLSRSLEWLYQATGQRDPAPNLAHPLDTCNLTAWRENVEVDGSIVELVLAVKGKGQQQLRI